MGQGQSYGHFSYEGQDVGQTRTNQASYTPQHHQNLQHEQFSGLQKHFDKRRGVSALSTPELLLFLKKEFSSTVHIIQNMIEEQNFDADGRSYICQVMKDVEYRIVEFNKSMKKGTTGNTDQYIKELQLKVQNQEDEITLLIASNKSAMKLIDHLKGIEKELEGNLNALNHEKQALIQRHSKIPGKQLVDDNPATDDLSDPKRPQKLGVFYSELYDNEWTDAFDALTNSGYDDKEAIVTLRLTLINVLEFCDSKSSTLLKKTEEAVNFLFKEYRDFQEKKSQKHLTLKVSQSGQWLSDSSLDCGSDEYLDVQERWKPKKSYQEQAKEQQEPEVVKKSDVIVQKLKGFRKEVAESMVPIVQKAYISAGWKHEYILELKPFIKKCIFLGWMMVVQSPPMCLATCDEGGRFDKNTFKEFTKSGPTVDFVVLPALYLYENGPLIGKGVAEARK